MIRNIYSLSRNLRGFFIFFFFKQKTAYEILGDWSSDVCSSDLVKGLGDVKLNDIVVFNYPAGDTLVNADRYQGADFYSMCYQLGQQIYEQQNGMPFDLQTLGRQQQMDHQAMIYELGKRYVKQNPNEYGDVITRPTNRRENYVKRCVGLPGQTLQIKNRIVYLDGKANKEPDNVQYTYYVERRGEIPEELMYELGISLEDLTSLNQNGYMPLTKHAYEVLRRDRKSVV